MTLLEIALCLLLILTSAFFSSAEIALFSLSRFQLRTMREKFRLAYKKVRRLLSDPSGVLITILVANEVVNISLSTIVTGAVFRTWDWENAWYANWMHRHMIPDWVAQTVVGTLITAPIVLFFCESTPKILGANANQVIAPLTAGGLLRVYDVFKPVRNFLEKILNIVQKNTGPDLHGLGDSEGKPKLGEKEFIFMLEEAQREGSIKSFEAALIKNVFELDDTVVSDILTPLNQVLSIPPDTTVGNLLSKPRSKRFSRIPVMKPGSRRVLGIAYLKDILNTKLEGGDSAITVKELMKNPLRVTPSMRLNGLFRRMRSQRTHLAVVESPGGDALGIITMADILEELFEHLEEELS